MVYLPCSMRRETNQVPYPEPEKTPQKYLQDLMELPKLQRILRLYVISLMQYKIAHVKYSFMQENEQVFAERLKNANTIMHFIEEGQHIDQRSRSQAFNRLLTQPRNPREDFIGNPADNHQIADYIINDLGDALSCLELGGIPLEPDEIMSLPIDEESVARMLELE